MKQLKRFWNKANNFDLLKHQKLRELVAPKSAQNIWMRAGLANYAMTIEKLTERVWNLEHSAESPAKINYQLNLVFLFRSCKNLKTRPE
jgi:hypothetical protein